MDGSGRKRRVRSLDDLLEHRETIVYRVPRCLEPNAWFLEGTVYASSIAIVAATGLLGSDPVSLAALAVALVGPVLYTLHCYVRDWSREAVVTDRRLLHRSGWRRPELTEIRVEEVAQVDAVRDQVRITRRDGSKCILGHPQDGWGLGVALARDAGVAQPRPTTVSHQLADYLWMVCGLTAAIALPVGTLTWLYPGLVDTLGSFGRLVPAAAFLVVGWLAHIIGICYGGYAAFLLLRPFYGFEQMAAWIDNSAIFWPSEGSPDETGPFDASSRRLVHLLYGWRPKPPPAGAS